MDLLRKYMNKNRYYDPFSALSKNNNSDKKLFHENEKRNNEALYIIKSSNKERILINKSVFKIGTKRELCDYIITDSKYVGRYHARIVIESGRAYFEDNNSTNKSYVNNRQVLPDQKIILKNGDEIKLADVLFKFVQE